MNGNFNNLIAIGSGACEQASTITDSISIGRLAHRYSGSDTSIIIGTNAGQYFGYVGRTNMTNNISIGHESMGAIFTGSNQWNLALGNQVMRTSGDFTNSRAYNTVIGHLSCYNLASNSNTVVGYNSLYNNNNVGSSGNSVFGANSANASILALVNTTFLGSGSNLASNFVCTNSTAVGSNALISESDTIVMGGLNGSNYPAVVLPTKVKLHSVITIGAVASYTIVLPIQENIIVSSSTTTTINLPTPATSSLGATIKIMRSFTSASPPNITIQATVGINISNNGVVSNTYTFLGTQSMIMLTMVDITGTAWTVSATRELININEIVNCYENTTNKVLTYGTTVQPAGIQNTMIGNNSGAGMSGTTPMNNTAVGYNTLRDYRDWETDRKSTR